jgi:hypothetical protein
VKRALIVDIDGTIACSPHRGPFDYFVTGRPERSRSDTEAWLNEHYVVPYRLFMREDGDRRKNGEVKVEAYAKHIVHDYTVLYAFDDMDMTTQMWRRCGITTFQVADDPKLGGAVEAWQQP